MPLLRSLKLRYFCTNTCGCGSGVSAYLRMTLSGDLCSISSMRSTWALGTPVPGSSGQGGLVIIFNPFAHTLRPVQPSSAHFQPPLAQVFQP